MSPGYEHRLRAALKWLNPHDRAIRRAPFGAGVFDKAPRRIRYEGPLTFIDE